MASVQWVFGLVWLAGGVFFVGWRLAEPTRPIWSRYIHVAPPAPKKRQHVPTLLGKVLTNVVGICGVIFLLSMGCLFIASAVSANGAAGWFGMIALSAFCLLLLLGVVSALLGSRLYLPAKPVASTVNAAHKP